MQVLITINDVSDFAKLLTNQHIHEHNFAVVIDKKIKLAYRDWQYQNYNTIKETFNEPVYVYDYIDYTDVGACAGYRKAFYYFQVFEKFDIWKPVVITKIDYVQHADLLAEKVEKAIENQSLGPIGDGVLLNDDLAICFYWYMAVRFCHAVDDRDKKQITKYNQLQLIQALARGEHDELDPMDFALVDLQTEEVSSGMKILG